MNNLLIGRRAVYTKINCERKNGEFVETGRELFHGTIAAIVTLGGDYRRVAVVMLYDDGSLRDHGIEDITVEGQSPEGALR